MIEKSKFRAEVSDFTWPWDEEKRKKLEEKEKEESQFAGELSLDEFGGFVEE